MSQYDLYTWFMSGVLVIWLVYRLLNPYKCQCGFWTWFFYFYRKHINAKHGVK